MHTHTNIVSGKKILFIGVPFYHYNQEIISHLQKKGAIVEYYNERDASNLYALVKSIKYSIIPKMQDAHYRKILKKIEGKKFDYLLVIRGYMMQDWFVQRVKQTNPHIKTILYQWDAYKNWECDFRYLIPHFDKVKTFDFNDAQELNIEYVPTFSPDEYANLSNVPIEYDLFYSGSFFHSRYDLLKSIIEYADEHKLNLRTHVVITKKGFYKERLQGNNIEAKYLQFKKLNKNQYIEIFTKSNVIVDYANPNQSGVTMRTLDALMAGKKILTSNKYITNLPCYNEEQIQIFDPKSFEVDVRFAKERLQFPKQNYSTDVWIENIFK